ncbi:acylphosphatase [Candidatus Woesearchaeota archaeon]|nr:acylphosphatase [Candidatus Woesearchaeota archaeon]
MVVMRVRMLLKGRVQNVTFRAFAKQNAGKLGLVGYAKNLRNGNLEIIAVGEKTKHDELVKFCRRGPLFAKIDSFDESFTDPNPDEEFEIFDIRY